jgi:predicted metal-dependent hydrolase
MPAVTAAGEAGPPSWQAVGRRAGGYTMVLVARTRQDAMKQKTPRQCDREITEHLARKRLQVRVRKLLDKWQPLLGVHIDQVHVRKMKSYWASINERASRMWVNADLAKYSPKYLECVVVHELVHMLTNGHDVQFYALMDRYLPGWRKIHQTFAGPMTQHS